MIQMDKYKVKTEYSNPVGIEKRSMEIIAEELKKRGIIPNPETDTIVRRVIHTTADFEYADQLYFSPNAVKSMRDAIRSGISIVTDTEMARAGINKKKLSEFGGRVRCFMSDQDVAEEAGKRGITRAAVSMEKAAGLSEPFIFAVGNAPTALFRLYELIMEGRISPAGIIGVPVGFVNVIEAKEIIMTTDVPCIVARGRKGGSNVAAAIVNALVYGI